MRKDLEMSNPNSCTNKARDNEMMFVLLGRDPVAPIVIRIWTMLRILIGKNNPSDEQIREANITADKMEYERKETIKK